MGEADGEQMNVSLYSIGWAGVEILESWKAVSGVTDFTWGTVNCHCHQGNLRRVSQTTGVFYFIYLFFLDFILIEKQRSP